VEESHHGSGGGWSPTQVRVGPFTASKELISPAGTGAASIRGRLATIHFLYRFRNLVEPFFNKLKHFRAIAMRFEKHDANYLALIKHAAARIWMRFMSR
jgi:transposase